MLRLTRTEAKDGVTIHLEGKLTGPWVGELRRLAAAQGERLRRLDLESVSFVDPAGAECLDELRRDGVEIGDASPFVRALLDRRA